MPSDLDEFKRTLAKVVADYGADANISEAELVNRWFTGGVFAALGYGTQRDDYRLELKTPSAGRADVVLRSFGQRIRVLVEFKRPKTDLAEHVRQVRDYANELDPDVAMLTNGRQLWVFGRGGANLKAALAPNPVEHDLESLAPADALSLFNQLRKIEVDISSLAQVEQTITVASARPIHVDGAASVGGAAFLERFQLDERSVFGRLVAAFYESLPPLQSSSQFTAGAYGFWQRAYARDLQVTEAPRSWLKLMGPSPSRAELTRFMFALESAYAVIARALLAKAMQDAGFPSMDAAVAFRNSAANHATRGAIPPAEHFAIATEVFSYAGRQAFQTLFASDLFDWWQDAGRLPQPQPMAEALVETVLAMFSFDFSGLAGDVLGELYQGYFDAETRLALGEFYTPPEIVEFILDEVGYVGSATHMRRLLDPACGSGTFLVAALRRYLAAHAGQDPRQILAHLIGGLWIVGFDVNPFAALLAQVNYAAQLLPLYAQALQTSSIAIHNLPVYRTDSLRFESREAETVTVQAPAGGRGGGRRRSAPPEGNLGFTLTYEGDMAEIRETLPVRTAGGTFVEVVLSVPRAGIALERQLLDNREEYALSLSALFDSVDANEGEPGLAVRLSAHGLVRSSDLAKFMGPALVKLEATLAQLRTQYEDGRFLKTLRDLAVAVVVKNELDYDYVVGNPPYVRVQRLPEELRRYWVGRYEWAAGNFDIYIPFIERAVTGWLKPGGRLGFICSSRFMLQNYGETLRSALPNAASVDLLVDFRDAQLFADATNYPVVLVATKSLSPGKESHGHAARVFDSGGAAAARLDDVRAVLAATRTNGAPVLGRFADAFPLDPNDLGRSAWLPMPAVERRVFDRIAASGPVRLEALTSTASGGFAGYQTSADDVMVFRLVEDRGDTLLLAPKGGGPHAEIERDAVRRWLFGQDVERWLVDWDSWFVLFPYVLVNGQLRLIPTRRHADMFDYASQTAPAEERWPLFLEYVDRPSVRAVLEAREGGRWREPSARHAWYAAARPQNLPLFADPKIVVQISSRKAQLAVDLGAYVFQAGGRGGGVYGLALLDPEEDWLHYLGALLNSRVLDYYLKHTSTLYRGGYYSYSDSFLKNLPIAILATDDPRRLKLVACSRRLHELRRALRENERARAQFPIPQLASASPALQRYALERVVEGGARARVFNRGAVSWRRQLDNRPAMLVGQTTLVFPSDPEADLVREWLALQTSASVATSDLMEMRIPDAAGCRRIIAILRQEEADAAALKQEIDSLEQQVDALVLDLYGLSGDQAAVAVLNDFLARF